MRAADGATDAGQEMDGASRRGSRDECAISSGMGLVWLSVQPLSAW
jgi:hypothetical protein